MKPIYLDYASSTPLDERVLKTLVSFYEKNFGNPNSLHFFGQKSLAFLDEARARIAKILLANQREIIFTSSASEANNLVLRGILKAYFRNLLHFKKINCPREEKFFQAPKVILSSIEHPSLLETAKDLEKDGALRVVYLPVNREGIIDLKTLEKELDSETILVSVMWVNNEVGSLEPISQIARLIKDFKEEKKSQKISSPFNLYPLFHTDASQALNYFDLNVLKSGVDLMTLSSHKIYGPIGIACLYVKSFLQESPSLIAPLVTGGDQEFGLRAGTENVASAWAFAQAVEIAASLREKEYQRIWDLALYFFQLLKSQLPLIETNSPLGQKDKWSPHILNLFLPYKENLVQALDLMGIAVSSTSACSQRLEKPSYVLKALGFDETRAKRSLRFSFGRPTTKKELELAAKRIIKFLSS